MSNRLYIVDPRTDEFVPFSIQNMSVKPTDIRITTRMSMEYNHTGRSRNLNSKSFYISSDRNKWFSALCPSQHISLYAKSKKMYYYIRRNAAILNLKTNTDNEFMCEYYEDKLEDSIYRYNKNILGV